jgi:hypothetical protein
MPCSRAASRARARRTASSAKARIPSCASSLPYSSSLSRSHLVSCDARAGDAWWRRRRGAHPASIACAQRLHCDRATSSVDVGDEPDAGFAVVASNGLAGEQRCGERTPAERERGSAREMIAGATPMRTSVSAKVTSGLHDDQIAGCHQTRCRRRGPRRAPLRWWAAQLAMSRCIALHEVGVESVGPLLRSFRSAPAQNAGGTCVSTITPARRLPRHGRAPRGASASERPRERIAVAWRVERDRRDTGHDLAAHTRRRTPPVTSPMAATLPLRCARDASAPLVVLVVITHSR